MVGRDTGGPPDRHYFGSALFIDPRGTVMARAGDKEDEILDAEIDPKRATTCASSGGFFKFRRPVAYGGILTGTA
jgi:predicted amidohydrolase